MTPTAPRPLARRAQAPSAPWPDPRRPGVPPDADEDGWHWLRGRSGDVAPCGWCATTRTWTVPGLEGRITAAGVATMLDYLGPVAEPPATTGTTRH